MAKLAGHRHVAAATTSALFAAASLGLSACTPTNRPRRRRVPRRRCGPDRPPVDNPGRRGRGQPAAQSVITQLKAPDGTRVATAKLDFGNGYATITIATTGAGHLAPGFHGVHIHKVGKCEANSVAPTGGAPGDFLSAGGHFQAPGHSVEPASGDLTSLEVRRTGSARW